MKALLITLTCVLLTMVTTLIFGEAVADIDERTPGHFESWVALFIVITALCCAFLLSHPFPKARALGALWAGIACLLGVGWFVFFVLNTGVMTAPKAFDTPSDAFKPALLWFHTSIFAIAGLSLVIVAYKQANSAVHVNLAIKNTANQYGQVSRVLHWAVAILFLAMIPMGIFATMIPEGVVYRIE